MYFLSYWVYTHAEVRCRLIGYHPLVWWHAHRRKGYRLIYWCRLDLLDKFFQVRTDNLIRSRFPVRNLGMQGTACGPGRSRSWVNYSFHPRFAHWSHLAGHKAIPETLRRWCEFTPGAPGEYNAGSNTRITQGGIHAHPGIVCRLPIRESWRLLFRFRQPARFTSRGGPPR
jgi:hypothetical protein